MLHDQWYRPVLTLMKSKTTIITRKRFSEKPIVTFTNSTVFILDFYMTEPVWFHVLALK